VQSVSCLAKSLLVTKIAFRIVDNSFSPLVSRVILLTVIILNLFLCASLGMLSKKPAGNRIFRDPFLPSSDPVAASSDQ